MTREEISKCYCIEDHVLLKYVKANIIHDKKDYSDEDIQDISMALSLEKIGFNLNDIAIYLSLCKDKKENKETLLSMLVKQRELLLTNVHKQENLISTLDYYIYDLRRDL